ncbi:MAG: histidinol dehydrogenase [Bacteroidales bacterium]|nr:histidinol dehydrogenase [Bacteroidales bacterium]
MKLIKNPQRRYWKSILRSERESLNELTEKSVRKIINDVRENGDSAIIKYEKLFDNFVTTKSGLSVSAKEFRDAAAQISPELADAIKTAAANIKKFHKAQKIKDIEVETSPGVTCRQKSVPINHVGLYIPGGTAPLFSTVIMLAVPAKLAGCREITLCTPVKENGRVAPEILYSASLCGIDKVFKIGGAVAIAAMAYGTSTVPKADKIFGPGNGYVTAAKKIVSSDACSIDMPAGPSEVMIIADETAVPKFVCADFLSQLEHGQDSEAVLLTTSEKLAGEVLEEFKKQSVKLSRSEYINGSARKSKIILLPTYEKMVDMANEYAPEHLIICTKNYGTLVDKITNAGSIFLGNYSPESAGDYASGTNHTLPTSGWAKSCSGVNLSSFLKRITIQEITRKGLEGLAPAIEVMAEAEGLGAHKNAVAVRMESKNE